LPGSEENQQRQAAEGDQAEDQLLDENRSSYQETASDSDSDRASRPGQHHCPHRGQAPALEDPCQGAHGEPPRQRGAQEREPPAGLGAHGFGRAAEGVGHLHGAEAVEQPQDQDWAVGLGERLAGLEVLLGDFARPGRSGS